MLPLPFWKSLTLSSKKQSSLPPRSFLGLREDCHTVIIFWEVFIPPPRGSEVEPLVFYQAIAVLSQCPSILPQSGSVDNCTLKRNFAGKRRVENLSSGLISRLLLSFPSCLMV